MSERDKRAEGYNLKEDSGVMRDPSSITSLRVPVLKPMELMVEASPRRIFANAHTYHINSISVNSDQVSRDDSCSLVISRGTEGDGYTRGYNNMTHRTS